MTGRLRYSCGSRMAVKSAFMVLLIAVGSVFSDEYYTEPHVYDSRPQVDREMSLDCIGAMDIKARIYPGVLLKVEGVHEGLRESDLLGEK